MVEFGAGGTITQAEEPVANEEPASASATVPATATEDAGENNGEAAPSPAVATSTTTPTTPAAPTPTRRKRKAKGWFCPVCRQPYTSLLRITTTPPEVPKNDEPEVVTGQTSEKSGGGGLLSNMRPTFLRGFSTRNPQNDVEAQRVAPSAA